eukprot:766433-Hanusia_phi.AAC.2
MGGGGGGRLGVKQDKRSSGWGHLCEGWKLVFRNLNWVGAIPGTACREVGWCGTVTTGKGRVLRKEDVANFTGGWIQSRIRGGCDVGRGRVAELLEGAVDMLCAEFEGGGVLKV